MKNSSLQTSLHDLKIWYQALVLDHNIINLFWRNLHPVVEGECYRSAQPTPWQWPGLVRQLGLRSVINLRGHRPHRPVYALQKSACDRLGLPMYDITLFSRAIPDDRLLLTLQETFEKAPKPTLLHCKAGADRSSLASVLYLHWMQKMPLEKAIAMQLRFFPYGYIRHSKAGVIDAFLKTYLHSQAYQEGVDLIEWVKQWHDKSHHGAFEAQFAKRHQKRWAVWLHENLLKRE